MKKKSTIITLIIAVSAAVLFILFYVFSPEGKKQISKKEEKIVKKPNDWQKRYGTRNLHPYGTFIFYNLIKHNNKNIRTLRKNSQYKNLDTISSQRRLYIYVGKKFDTHYKRMNKILAFVERGNDAFIAADVFPYRIENLISDNFKTHRSYYKEVFLNFTDTAFISPRDYKFKFIYKRKNIYRYWTDLQRIFNYDTWSQEIFVHEKNTVTSNPVFVSIPYGKGRLYLYTVPYAFTNVAMKYEIAVAHAERVISSLPDEPVIFDNFINSTQNGNSGGDDKGNPIKRTSPLQFILDNRSLRWAYYLLLTMVGLYILFRAKRKLKVIPPKETFENNSVEFADTMSKLYLQYGQHKYIVFQQERNFINYLRSKYYINSPKVDEDYIERVSKKSGIEKERIDKIFKRFAKVKTGNYATSSDVVEIYAEIDYFYKNCK